jgi:hypothetical protein
MSIWVSLQTCGDKNKHICIGNFIIVLGNYHSHDQAEGSLCRPINYMEESKHDKFLVEGNILETGNCYKII